MRLCAVLLNPPLGSSPDTVTVRNAAVASHVLGASEWVIGNLVDRPTRDLPELNEVGVAQEMWVTSRPLLGEEMATADALLFGWGVGGFTLSARSHFQRQVLWVLDEARRMGLTSGWTLGGLPRHPSRWRQYLGPQRNLFDGGSFEDRLRRALVPTPLDELKPPYKKPGRIEAGLSRGIPRERTV